MFRHLDIENECIFRLITLPQSKQSQASSAAAPRPRLTDNYLSNRSTGSSLAVCSLPFICLFQSPPEANLSSLPRSLTCWPLSLWPRRSFAIFFSSSVSSFSFSVTFSPCSHVSCLLLPCSLVSCFPYLSPSRGLIISLMSHPIKGMPENTHTFIPTTSLLVGGWLHF